MIIHLEWRIPWSDVKPENRMRAAEKLCDYVNRGTMFDVTRRMKAHASVGGLAHDPFITIELES